MKIIQKIKGIGEYVKGACISIILSMYYGILVQIVYQKYED